MVALLSLFPQVWRGRPLDRATNAYIHRAGENRFVTLSRCDYALVCARNRCLDLSRAHDNREYARIKPVIVINRSNLPRASRTSVRTNNTRDRLFLARDRFRLTVQRLSAGSDGGTTVKTNIENSFSRGGKERKKERRERTERPRNVIP